MHPIGVVPIFMSAGAAALPTILAALTSVTAILLKPRELIRLCRTHPLKIGGSLTIVAAICGAGIWWWTRPPAALAESSPIASEPGKYDWVAIAQNIIDQQNAGKVPTAVAGPAQMDSAVVLGRNYARCSFAGTTAPIQLAPKWAFQPNFTMFLAMPAVAGNRVFAAATKADPSGFYGKLACLDSDTGEKIWECIHVDDDYFHAFFSSPAITSDGKYLIIGEGLHENADCKLRCFDAASGDFRWAVATPLHIESSPAIFHDMVVVGCGAIEGSDRKATGDPGHVLAVRISDGKELWRAPVNDPESSPAIDDRGIVYIGSGVNGNAVVALRSETDEDLAKKKLDRILWKTPTDEPATSAITLAGDLVVTGIGNSDFAYADPNPAGAVVAMERATGNVRWTTKFPDAVLGEISFKDGKLICPVRTGEIAALDAADGHLLWKTAISGTAPTLAGCAFTGKRVYAVSSDGYMAILDSADGKVLEKIYLNDQKTPGSGKSLSGPQVINGKVYVGSETGGLHCYVGTRSAE